MRRSMSPLPLTSSPRRAANESNRVSKLHRVVERQAARLDAVFAALGHPARRSIVRQLARGEASVSELARPLDMSLNAIAKHLAVLTAAGLIEDRKRGRIRHCQLVPGPLRVAQAWLGDYGDFWEEQFDSLAAHLGGPAWD